MDNAVFRVIRQRVGDFDIAVDGPGCMTMTSGFATASFL